MIPASKTIKQNLKEELRRLLSESINRCQWAPKESHLHINALELKTIKLALLTFAKMFQLQSVHFKVDNMAALSYTKKVGPICNKGMIAISKEIWIFSISKEITIAAEYLPESMNVIPDLASRNFQDSSEWLLCQK